MPLEFGDPFIGRLRLKLAPTVTWIVPIVMLLRANSLQMTLRHVLVDADWRQVVRARMYTNIES